MKERPILFSAPMVRAILSGAKTQTRRVVKDAGDHILYFRRGEEDPRRWVGCDGLPIGHVYCPYGVPGDRLFWTMAAPSWAGQTPEERFWARVIKTPSCWEWLGGVAGHARHGRLKIGQAMQSTHRYSWSLHNGDPGDKHVLHTCDVGWCVNPGHLYLGTSVDNRRDQTDRGRIRHLYGSANPAAKLADGAADEIRRLYAAGAEQADLALQYGVTQPHVSKIVNAKRRFATEGAPLALLGSRWLEVTDVRVERLQSISEEAARAEGVDPLEWSGGPANADARAAFHELWDRINGSVGRSWNDNPWIWALAFTVVK
jgi:hypothetical protein